MPSLAQPALASSRAEARAAGPRRLAVTAISTSGASVAVMAAVAALGHSAAVPPFPSAAPWPPWSIRADPPASLVAVALWSALLLGTAGLATGLLAASRGWRPRPGPLVAGSVVAVLALTVTPPVGSTDMLDYAIYGRIATLGHSPYRMTPLELKAAGDPVGAVAPLPWDDDRRSTARSRPRPNGRRPGSAAARRPAPCSG